MNENELKKTLESLVYALRGALTDREAMKATMREYAKKSKLLEGWENEYKAKALNPHVEILRTVNDQLDPLEATLSRGVNEKNSEEIQSQARDLEHFFRRNDRY